MQSHLGKLHVGICLQQLGGHPQQSLGRKIDSVLLQHTSFGSCEERVQSQNCCIFVYSWLKKPETTLVLCSIQDKRVGWLHMFVPRITKIRTHNVTYLHHWTPPTTPLVFCIPSPRVKRTKTIGRNAGDCGGCKSPSAERSLALSSPQPQWRAAPTPPRPHCTRIQYASLRKRRLVKRVRYDCVSTFPARYEEQASRAQGVPKILGRGRHRARTVWVLVG